MSLTCVSGYWKVKNKHNSDYDRWFSNTLSINCPYVFFSDKEGIEYIKRFRGNLPTHYIELDIPDFYTYQYRDKMKVHPIHCPSVELLMIWYEKIFLVEKASKLNPFGSEWFHWIDAGICTYRNSPPPNVSFPSIHKLKLLPKKFIFSSSDSPVFEPNKLSSYYHYIAGTSYLLHKNVVDPFVELYKQYLNKIHPDNLWTDQVLLTHMFKEYTQLFFKLADGYGEVTRWLF